MPDAPESYNLLELVEFCCSHAGKRHERISPNSKARSPVSEAIMDHIAHNVYDLLIDGKVFMRVRYAFKSLDAVIREAVE